MKRGFQIRHFLIVEDDANDAVLIRRTFSSLSPRCTSFVCRNTSEARAYLIGAGMYTDRNVYPMPDAIISDVRMPGETGVGLIRWLRSEEAFNEIPVVVLTGEASPEEVRALESLDVQLILRKPARGGSLKVMLQNVAQQLCSEKMEFSAEALLLQ